MTSDIQKNIWEKEKYYQLISKKEDFSHPGFKIALKYSKHKENILDVGCGDGSKLAHLGNVSSKRTGVEKSRTAVELGKKKYPKSHFILETRNRLPFANEHFDLVTSFFVLEHTEKSEELILEMIRVAKSGGIIIWLAPNFGAPNRASPNFVGSRLNKLLVGLLRDFQNTTCLNWQKVEPKVSSIEEFLPDLDTIVEPYLRSLIAFTKGYGEILETNSFWELELGKAKTIQKITRILGMAGFYPFKYWGPHLFLVLRKR